MNNPRGLSVCLPHGGLPELYPPYIQRLIEKTGGERGPIGKQFIAQPQKEKKFSKSITSDPLNEDEFEVAPGLVYKYKGNIDAKRNVVRYGRALWTITRFCAAYCRFCTRGREVGAIKETSLKTPAALSKTPFLSKSQIQEAITFLKNHKEINEVILSGGDPLTTQQEYFEYIIDALVALQKQGHLSIIRIGTRLPVSNPQAIHEWHYTIVSKLQNPYIMVHINHPNELTEETITVLNNFRKTCLATVMSQTVLLKGVNDSVETLHELFVTMAVNGIRPYYVYQCDPVYWAQHMIVPIKKAIKLWGRLRPMLSGVAATARLVIDVPDGYGKIPLPEGNAWEVNYTKFTDFQKIVHKL